MNGINQTVNVAERIASVCMKINKYLLWIPVMPALFFATSESLAMKTVKIQHTLPSIVLMLGLLCYPLLYAFSFALAPKCAEKCKYYAAIMLSLSPVACLLLALAGYMSLTVRT